MPLTINEWFVIEMFGGVAAILKRGKEDAKTPIKTDTLDTSRDLFSEPRRELLCE